MQEYIFIKRKAIQIRIRKDPGEQDKKCNMDLVQGNKCEKKDKKKSPTYVEDFSKTGVDILSQILLQYHLR